MIAVHPSSLQGTIKMQPSKSVLHRLLICAALGDGESRIGNYARSDDIQATLQALADMGLCEYEIKDGSCVLQGGLRKQSKTIIDCGESGSTLRFLIPLAFDGQDRLFTGKGRLLERPMQPYEVLFSGMGYKRTTDGIRICGTLLNGEYRLPGDVSSQFITGLLFVLPSKNGPSRIILDMEPESKPYIDLTQQCQSEFGVYSTYKNEAYLIEGNQAYRNAAIIAEGDYSHAAFFAVAAAIAGDVVFSGLNPASLQGDKQIFDLLRVIGAHVAREGDSVRVMHAPLRPVEIDVSNIPDLFPALAVLGCAVEGRVKIFNAHRLRFKESDRLSAMASELETLGADVVEYEDSMVINGTGRLRGGAVCTHGDHRIAMALTMASCIADGDIVLDNETVVSKSAPDFYQEFALLGGKYD